MLEPASILAKAWEHTEYVGGRSKAWRPSTVLVTGAGPIGLLAARHAVPKGTKPASKAQHAGIHVELSTDDLDGLYKRLKARGVVFTEPPHDEAWERSAQARDPDGYTVEFAQGRRGRNAPRG